ncbi:MAG TPA: carboxypeptidase regulatory-like domain-containing protein [Polyangiaceae bacterium]|nr:carboxypeptidase regulatory-like domain-containing protein [Polyangiaceae bacterium]
MKSSTVSILALALGSVAIAAVVACEGEPPKTAEAPLGAITPQLPAPEESASAAAPEPATTCCQCNCPGGQMVAVGADAGARVAVAGDAGVAEGGAAPPPAAATQGDIVGDIVTTPAYLKGASVVYLEDAPKEPNRGMTAHIENRQMAFAPLVQVVTAGGSVSFVNSDPFPHNVFSGDHERFDLGLVQPGHSITHKFNNAGVYTLLCNLHPNMLGYIVVSPSSYFAKTDARGHFRLKDVPLGTYKITAWAPRLTPVTESVTLKGAEATMSFELHR